MFSRSREAEQQHAVVNAQIHYMPMQRLLRWSPGSLPRAEQWCSSSPGLGAFNTRDLHDQRRPHMELLEDSMQLCV